MSDLFEKILATPNTQLGRARRFLLLQAKLWLHCARLLQRNRVGQQVAALAYHTLFGLVPLAIVTLLIFQSFPDYSNIGGKLQGFVYRELNLSSIEMPVDPNHPTAEPTLLTDYLDDTVRGFFANVNHGSITVLGTVLVIWAALALLANIERAFNRIWHVIHGRSLVKRVINFWALLTLGPLLLGLGIHLTVQTASDYAAIERIQKTLLEYAQPMVMSYLTAVLALFLLYYLLPNTRVEVGPALWGAVVAALAWSLTKWGFGMYITRAIPFAKVYGLLGLIPLSVLWIYLSWVIVLFGVQLTFTTQHLSTLDAAQIASVKKGEDFFIANDVTVINILREIASAFEHNQGPVPSELICSRLELPAAFGERILEHLVEVGLLIRSSEPTIGYVPANVPENIKLSDVADMVAKASFSQQGGDASTLVDQIVSSQRALLTQYNLRQLLDDKHTTEDEPAKEDDDQDRRYPGRVVT
jgi:membrane protein